MDIPISTQLAQIAASTLVGAGLGLFYDFLRIFRIRLRHNIITLLLDLVFWIVGILALFSLGLGPGQGTLRLFMVIFVLFGSILYFLGLSKLIMRIFTLLFDTIIKIIALFKAPALRIADINKKLLKKQKKLFQKSAKWFTITFKNMCPEKQLKKPVSILEEEDYEAQTGKYHYEDYHNSSDSLRRDHTREFKSPDRGNQGTQSAASGRRRRAGSKKRGISI